MINNLSYESPQVAVFLRRLAWESFVAHKAVSVSDAITKYVRSARLDLGLRQYLERSNSGGADDFLQKRYREGSIRSNDGILELTERAWSNEWRLLFLPSHGIIRQLSIEPVCIETSQNPANFRSFSVSLRDPAIPTLDIFVGQGTALSKACAKRRGIYFLGFDSGMYIGKTDEFETRWDHHQRSQPAWAVFVSLKEHADFFTLDSLAASEGMLISLWNETNVVLNRNRGSDRKPAFPYLQQSILFIEGASAFLIWLARNNVHSVRLPFKS
jgi:hypothetical protein